MGLKTLLLAGDTFSGGSGSEPVFSRHPGVAAINSPHQCCSVFKTTARTLGGYIILLEVYESVCVWLCVCVRGKTDIPRTEMINDSALGELNCLFRVRWTWATGSCLLQLRTEGTCVEGKVIFLLNLFGKIQRNI